MAWRSADRFASSLATVTSLLGKAEMRLVTYQSESGPRVAVKSEAGYVDVVGSLDTYLTITGYAVTPLVGFVREGFELKLDQQAL